MTAALRDAVASPIATWRDDAACAQLPHTHRAVAFWKPPTVLTADGKKLPDWSAAAEICAGCPVIRQCKVWARSERYRTEFAGGLLPPPQIRSGRRDRASETRHRQTGAGPDVLDADSAGGREVVAGGLSDVGAGHASS